ncbi:FadR/GntR family transcriptional regulator [Oceanobacillus timonensis]|uniref:FadR/GntR family transcriptional regulator n=1 Tax=Oceanobacillus timonensis TaxID=1926285 RepID=UPI0015C41F70|nr:FCD domain-containing protein [Oceanobacillus timonensis]
MRGNFNTVYEKLKDEIVNEELKEGAKLLSLSRLSDKYDVGVSTVREVLRALQSQSFVKIEQGRGTFVTYDSKKNNDSISKSEIRDLMNLTSFRTMMEPSFAGIAAVQAFQYEIDLIVESANKMKELAENEEDTKKEDLNFHLLIAKATHNSYAINFYVDFQEQLSKGRKHTNVPGMIEKAAHYHMMIAEAIRTRNSSQAKMYMQAHMESNEELAINLLF